MDFKLIQKLYSISAFIGQDKNAGVKNASSPPMRMPCTTSGTMVLFNVMTHILSRASVSGTDNGKAQALRRSHVLTKSRRVRIIRDGSAGVVYVLGKLANLICRLAPNGVADSPRRGHLPPI
jgi:hypothetical protein